MKRKRNAEKTDRDNPAWTKATFARSRKARDVLPEIFGSSTAARMLKPRGRPKTGNARTSISLRLPPETLARWKATGPGWQTRMAEALQKAL
ncbi:MAG: BrnA antitoxin family protein [Pseudomonadota bacterium]|nr:BrnA antitoxin family protein [Pseudomonadota bacterium]